MQTVVSETTASPELPTLLLVDDDEPFRNRLARALTDRGYAVSTAESVDAALVLAEADPPEFAVVDLKMPGRSGLDLVRALHALDENTRIVVLTGYGAISTAVDAIKLGATHYLQKPAQVDEILAGLQRSGPPDEASQSFDFDPPSLAQIEWEHINRVLTDTGGSISESARRLGLHRRSLQRKLGKFRPP